MKKYKWFRKLVGGVWEKWEWNALGKKKSEWRKVHNGKWCETKVE